MYIIDVIPLLPISENQPQILSYFWPEIIKPGSLVFINIRNRKEKAVVLDSEPLAKRKILLKKGEKFQLKKIEKVLSGPIISQKQLQLALWLSDYYYAPLGLCLKLFIPKISLKNFKLLPKKEIQQSVDLIIIPEIAWINYLTKSHPPRLPASDAAGYGGQVKAKSYCLLHSGLSKKELAKEFIKIFSGQVDTIISTRIGLFLPYRSLTSIVVYDEGDEAYFSDMTPKYNAVVIAQKLAEIYGTKITFISEYPSIPDPYQPADKYQLLNSKF